MTDEPNYPEPVSQLINLGKPVNPWPDYPAKYGLTKAHIPDLIRMATDAHTWEEDDKDPAVYRNVHAWRALGQLRAVEAVPELVKLFAWVDEYNDDWTGEDLPEAMGLIGPEAIPALSAYLADPQHGLWARAGAATSLEQIGKQYPEAKAAAAAEVARVLARYEENDPDLNADLIAALAELRQPETYSVVEQAFQADKVEPSIGGDWEDFQVEVGLLDKRITPRPRSGLLSNFPFRSVENPEVPPKPKAKQEDKKAKNKRKQEKASRKQNRKKKK